jgi:hypothetical protein
MAELYDETLAYKFVYPVRLVQGGAIALVHECPPCQTDDAVSQQRVAGLSFKTGILVRG